MKKLLVLFTLVFGICLAGSEANAQCSSMNTINVGEIEVGQTFTMYVGQTDIILDMSPTLRLTNRDGNTTTFRLIEGVARPERIAIGEVTVRSGSTIRCNTIYGIITKGDGSYNPYL